MGDLSKYFNKKKFKCQCGCGICNVDEEFLYLLDSLRQFVDAPIHVNSGCRCPYQNDSIGGKQKSSHLTTEEIKCKGADIRTKKAKRFLLLLGAMLIFRRVGIAKTWLHVDNDKTKPQEVYWIYG